MNHVLFTTIDSIWWFDPLPIFINLKYLAEYSTEPMIHIRKFFSRAWHQLFKQLHFLLLFFRIHPMTASRRSICFPHQYMITKWLFCWIVSSFTSLSSVVGENHKFLFCIYLFLQFHSFSCSNWSNIVFKSTSIIRSSTLILSPWRQIISYCTQGLESKISGDPS